ncbi:MAG: translation initiation factor IF-2 [Oscillospiraceae bacterium]|jgi:translation initiation factor IF-2|nr:translation initiation factor IF-2 [Oscillospiraceae bacterium]
MLDKIRIKDIAAQIGVTNKEITELLSHHFEGAKNLNSVLQEAELNLIFEHYSLARGVENFDAFFALAEQRPKKESPKPEGKKADGRQKPRREPSAAPRVGQKAPTKAERQASEEIAKQVAGHRRRPEAKTVTDLQSLAGSKPADAAAGAPPNGAAPKKKKEGAPQSRTRSEARTVDTRSGNVDLEKYNERYEQIAGQPQQQGGGGRRRGSDSQQSKQKLTQKSRQYRKQGMRSSRHETEAERLRRIAAERAKKPQLVIKVGDEIQVSELALLLKRTAAEVVKKLFVSFGQTATVNDMIDFDTAALVATELGARVEREVIVTIEERIIDDSTDKEEDLQPRDPVVVVMGHVDHGKTSLLDAVRDTAVTETEAGGITQHIGAYRAEINGRKITFLDTPGHAAFTAMRARGAQATDIAILVVAADDGIMPQTVEAINHAKAAGVSIVVAVNKIDKPNANPERVLQQLTEYELVPEEWGGETICVPVSAKTREGLDALLESLLLVAEMRELKANPNRAARGVVIEARLDRTRGPIATLLVQNGTLKTGDVLVAGEAVGRVRVMTDYKGSVLQTAGPSEPVEIMGLAEAPQAGDSFDAVTDERLARELVEQRKYNAKEDIFNQNAQVTLETLFDSLKEGERKDLNIIVKADVQGSAEAVKQNLLKLGNEEVRVRVIHTGVGAVSESDVMLASASGAIVVAFNVSSDPIAAQIAEREGVQLRTYRIIYDMLEDVQQAVKGMLAPKYREVALGRVEVRQVMKISSVGTVAGSYVLDGKVQRGAKCRVVRGGVILAEDELSSLRRFKDDVKEVAAGYECGVTLAKFTELKEGDVFEVYFMEEYRD